MTNQIVHKESRKCTQVNMKCTWSTFLRKMYCRSALCESEPNVRGTAHHTPIVCGEAILTNIGPNIDPMMRRWYRPIVWTSYLIATWPSPRPVHVRLFSFRRRCSAWRHRPGRLVRLERLRGRACARARLLPNTLRRDGFVRSNATRRLLFHRSCVHGGGCGKYRRGRRRRRSKRSSRRRRRPSVLTETLKDGECVQP